MSPIHESDNHTFAKISVGREGSGNEGYTNSKYIPNLAPIMPHIRSPTDI